MAECNMGVINPKASYRILLSPDGATGGTPHTHTRTVPPLAFSCPLAGSSRPVTTTKQGEARASLNKALYREQWRSCSLPWSKTQHTLHYGEGTLAENVQNYGMVRRVPLDTIRHFGWLWAGGKFAEIVEESEENFSRQLKFRLYILAL
jgi:hypothetical protein